MNKKITSALFLTLFVVALVATSCSSGKKAHRCPAYNGAVQSIDSDNSKLPA